MTDTAAKRAAALGVGMPPGVVLPVPDGTIDAQDRAQLAGVYLPTADAPPGDPAFIGPLIGDLRLLVDVEITPRDFSSYFEAAEALTFAFVGTPPAGLTLSSAGVLEGTPTDVEVAADLIIQADDGTLTADSNSFSIYILASLGGGDELVRRRRR